MEDVLEVYTRPYDTKRPQVCMDEGSKELVTELREALPMQAAHPRRIDYEYDPNGCCNVFVACEPLRGKRFCRCASDAPQSIGRTLCGS